MKLKMANKPHHGVGPHAKPREMKGLMAGAHVPQRIISGNSDARGYQDSPSRRNGRHTGRPARGDTGLVKSGNSEGTAAPGIGKGKGVQGSPDSHLGNAGRGGTGRIGKGDSYKGAPTKYPEDISHSAFERLGSE